jgi:hypothetical protein
VVAAHDGRVDVLFVARGVERWGTFDRTARAVRIHDEERPGSEELLDLAAVQTLRNGGTVYAVPPTDIPGNAQAVALLRY